jgi:peptide-methionine (R)-S-oxide reductase
MLVLPKHFVIHPGVYKCVKCGNDLFHGKSKYSHSTPWPAFSETIREDSVRKEVETVPQESSRAKAMKVSRLSQFVKRGRYRFY